MIILYLSIVLAVVFAIVLGFAVVWSYRKYHHSHSKSSLLPLFQEKTPPTEKNSSSNLETTNLILKNFESERNFERELKVVQTPRELLQPSASPDFKITDAKEIVFEREIGKGKFGRVWRGTWVRKNQTIRVALREIHPNQQIPEKEAWTQLLPHRNVVQLFGVLQISNGPRYLVSEFVASGSLWDLLLLGPPLSEPQSVKMIQVIAQALDHLHSNQVIHGDLSAKNILLKHSATGWEPKLDDYALSLFWNSGDEIDHLKIMSPEWFQSKVYSFENDIWSFGILMIQLFTCDELYANASKLDLLSGIPSGKLNMNQFIGESNSSVVPSDLRPAIASCFKDSQTRPAIKILSQQLHSLPK